MRGQVKVWVRQTVVMFMDTGGASPQEIHVSHCSALLSDGNNTVFVCLFNYRPPRLRKCASWYCQGFPETSTKLHVCLEADLQLGSPTFTTASECQLQ